MTMKTILHAAVIAVCAAMTTVASAAIDISTGRQLFVDDFLVDSATNVVRHFNSPVKMEAPIVWPGGGAAPKTVDGTSCAKAGAAGGPAYKGLRDL